MANVNPTQSAFVLDRTSDIDRDAKGTSFSVTYKGPQDSAVKSAFYAAYPLGTPHGTYTTSEIYGYNERPLGGTGDSSGMVEIAVRYKPSDSSASGVLGLMRPGDSTLESDSNTVEQPIAKLPPEWKRSGGTQATWDAQLADFKVLNPGIEGWIDPQPTITRTDAVASSSFTFTEAQIMGDVGKVMTDGAMSAWGVLSPQTQEGKTRWLYTNKRITKNGETVTISRTAQMSKEYWETSYIYRFDGTETPENP